MVKGVVTWKDGTTTTAIAQDWDGLFNKFGAIAQERVEAAQRQSESAGEMQSFIAHKIGAADIRQGREGAGYERGL